MSHRASTSLLRIRSVWATRAGVLALMAAVVLLVVNWTHFGLTFYERVIPYYDSMAYQNAYWNVAQQAAQHGKAATVVSVWKEPNMVVLYKFFAALFSGVVPAGKAGLYVYLYGIHVAAMFTLIAVTRGSTGSWYLALLALAAWLGAVPFSQLREGVADQRMDLASASFYLMIVALALAWSRAPSAYRAVGVGTVAALAVLHRPVMVASIMVVAAIFAIRAWLRHRRPARAWWLAALAMAGPGLILAAPWLLRHAAELRHYYFGSNVDVGSAPTIVAAAIYNWQQYERAFGPNYAGILLAGMVWIVIVRRIEWLDALALVLAALVPLAFLAISRSSGNPLVPQLSLGVPALLLSVARRTGDASRAESPLLLAASVAALGLTVVSAQHGFARELRDVRVSTRTEAEVVVREIATERSKPRVAAFQAWPVDIVGLLNISRSIECEFTVGTYAYHPSHFGISNEAAAHLSPAEKNDMLEKMIRRVEADDDLLMLPTADTSHRLSSVPFSHSLIPEMRRLVEGNPAFVRLRRTSAIDGMCFDLFAVRRK